MKKAIALFQIGTKPLTEGMNILGAHIDSPRLDVKKQNPVLRIAIYGSSEIMNLLNWGEQDKDYVIEDADNGIINFPEGITSDNAGYNLNLGWELPNQFIAYKWTGSDPQLWEKKWKNLTVLQRAPKQ